MMKTKMSSYFQSYKQSSEIKMRLFCFPYAGGGASVFSRWADDFTEGLELIAVQFPGRETRFGEKPFSDLTTLVQVVVSEIRPYLSVPFAFFGHSMGALVCFEMARSLRKFHYPQPFHLFVSGFRAPQLKDPDPPIHQLPDTLFLEELKALGGIPENALDIPELMELMLPIIRQDVKICECYTYSKEPALDCSISSYGGLRDKKISKEQLAAWEAQTTGDFALRMFNDDHFFINNLSNPLVHLITRKLNQLSNKKAYGE